MSNRHAEARQDLGRPTDAVFALVLAATVVLALGAHRMAGLTLPVPSGDEAFFLWQARAFQTSGSFTAPELDPSRPVLLLPFLYPGLLGALFTLTGPSLAAARGASLAFELAGFALLAWLVRRRPLPVASLLLVVPFALNARFVVMGNFVRMEALLFLLVMAAWVLIERRRAWDAMALLALAMMVHPNALLHLAPAAAYGVIAGGLRRDRPDRVTLALAALAALAWAAHGVYVLRFWDGFVHDTAHRLGEAATGTGKHGLAELGGRPLRELVGIAALTGLGAALRAPVGPFMAIALGAWMHGRLRVEEWYQPFGDLVAMMLALGMVQVAGALAARLAPGQALARRAAAAGVVAAALLLMLRSGQLDGPRRYREELSFSGMRAGPPGAYFDAADREALRRVLDAERPGRAITVEVYPWTDAFLFADFADGRVRYQVPFFAELFRPREQWLWGYGPTEPPAPDLLLLHVSPHTPPHLRFRPDSILARAARAPGLGPPQQLRTHAPGETWYALRRVDR